MVVIKKVDCTVMIFAAEKKNSFQMKFFFIAALKIL